MSPTGLEIANLVAVKILAFGFILKLSWCCLLLGVKTISMLIRSLDMTYHAIKFDRFSKFVLTVIYAWENTFVRLASYLMMIYLRNNIIAVAVAFAGLEGMRISSTATSVVTYTCVLFLCKFLCMVLYKKDVNQMGELFSIYRSYIGHFI
ncbi:hypothetical protein FEM48_Zijuj01G0157700 [Ziziphus jujuba var. spinosa]|uniref:Uncharacterized protein n=1 Tax=Ziziphus jujuba var. spinosa TaxID=714518 RepID=A0A978W248_ZIZJJ|nr:hypothetical protein FEM48_Zijuj01G0157700 [Ziziphus jujuba var. spinosa]